MYRIALVEDEKYNADRFCDILKAYAQKENVEFQIQWYRDALTFLEEYAEGVDIVFMDIRMPVMDGMEAARKLGSGTVPWCWCSSRRWRSMPFRAMRFRRRTISSSR